MLVAPLAAQASLLSNGSNFVELATNANSAAWQNVTTAVGEGYLLSGCFSPRIGVAAASSDIDVFWIGLRLSTLGGSGTGRSAHDWNKFGFTVIGTGADVLRFSAAGLSDSLGGSLDKVPLNSSPEPGSLALALTAPGATGA